MYSNNLFYTYTTNFELKVPIIHYVQEVLNDFYSILTRLRGHTVLPLFKTIICPTLNIYGFMYPQSKFNYNTLQA